MQHLALRIFHPITNNDETGAEEWMVEKKGHSPMTKKRNRRHAPSPRGPNDGGPLVEGAEASVNGSGS
jgi:hypothetical protein